MKPQVGDRARGSRLWDHDRQPALLPNGTSRGRITLKCRSQGCAINMSIDLRNQRHKAAYYDPTFKGNARPYVTPKTLSSISESGVA